VSPRPTTLVAPEIGHRRYLKLRSVLYDRITGLPAFPVLIDQLRSWLEERRAVGVVHIETVNLDLVESLYGWQVFDRILTRIADTLDASRGDPLPAQSLLGLNGVAGDRFAAFVPEGPGGSEPTARFLADVGSALESRLAETFSSAEFAGLNPRLEFKVGHALLTHDPFYRFERRVYAALEDARALHGQRERRRQRGVGADLRRIIDESDLNTVFQPVVELGSREILGFEALSRGPEGTAFEAPRALFDASESCGVANDLDHACREAALTAWSGLNSKHTVFLNGLSTSFAGVRDDGVDPPDWLRRLTDTPHGVVLEFSERGADADPEGFVSTLSRLKERGIGIAVDDIGTGFGSQEILEDLHPDYLKLDGSLVRKIDQNLIKQELLHSLVRIANRIGASVIAEGVETEDEALALAAAGAHYGQGYLFARPSSCPEELGGRVP
jgi:EAL domain-containing protein (putative c-di-GMP-specific phosphodiesterase class I)/GGDEF domain-containing protein